MKQTIQIRRIYEAIGKDDGLRILVDRLWPRGVKKEVAGLDGWAKDVAPTPDLRKWFSHKPERFEEFTARYRDELARNPAAEDLLRLASTIPVLTLVYAARDPIHNHAAVLQEYLRENLAKT